MVIINRRKTKRKCFFWSFGFPAPSTAKQTETPSHHTSTNGEIEAMQAKNPSLE
jgi:hypothetical protein